MAIQAHQRPFQHLIDLAILGLHLVFAVCIMLNNVQWLLVEEWFNTKPV